MCVEVGGGGGIYKIIVSSLFENNNAYIYNLTIYHLGIGNHF